MALALALAGLAIKASRAFPSQISSIRLRKASCTKSTKRALAAHVISFTCNCTCLLPQVNENDKARSEMRCSEQGQISCFEASHRRAVRNPHCLDGCSDLLGCVQGELRK